MKMIRSLAIGLCLTAGFVAAGQHAEATTYQVATVFDDGGMMTGSFDYDSGTLSNVDITTSGGNMAAHYTSGMYFSDSDPWSGDLQNFIFYSGSYGLNLLNLSNDPNFAALSWSAAEYIDGTSSYRSGGATFTAVSVVTPIPAALPLAASALAGLGGLGWLKRRRTQVDVASAA